MGCTPDCAIGIMAKAPRAGMSKTRLCPPLRPDQAAALSAAFLRDISENIALAARDTPITGYVAYAPKGTEALFDGHLARGTGRLLADGSPLMPPDVQGLGRCLLHAITAMLARGHQSAVVVNADGPTLPTARLVRAAVALEAEGDRVVLGPADDGGYYLLGVKAAHAHLFADIGWSTDSVATTTRIRAAELGLEVVELPSWYDVDDPELLNRLAAETSDPAVMAGAASTVHKVSSANHLAGWPPGPRRTQAPPGNGAFGPAREPAVTELDLVPYAAPFTARALARMGLPRQDLREAAE